MPGLFVPPAAGGGGGLDFRGYITGSISDANSTWSLDISGSLTGGSGSTVQAGDLCVVFYGNGSGDTDNTMTATATGTTFTDLMDLYANDSFDTNFGVSFAIMPGTVPSSITLAKNPTTLDDAAACVMFFQGHNTSTPVDTTNSGSATGINGNAANPPSVTPVNSGATIIAAGMFCQGSSTSYTYTAIPTGYTDTVEVQPALGSGRHIVLDVCYKENWTSGAEDPAAYTTSGTKTSHSWAAATIIVIPA